MTTASPFYIPVDLRHTALLLSDIQTQILARFPKETQESYLANIQTLLTFFRTEITRHRTEATSTSLYDEVPLIVHHTLPFNLNNNAFVSPYNKLAKWVHQLEEKGLFSAVNSDPHHPDFAIPEPLAPWDGWGSSKDEIVLGKLQPNCFASSDLLAYFRARGIRHVVLVGLTTMGSILGSARGGADLDFHIIAVREGVIDDDPEVDEFLMERVLPKFIDVVSVEDVMGLRGK